MTKFSSLDLKIALILIIQIIIGILGNFLLLIRYICLHIRGSRLRSTEFILMHLTVANSLFIFFSGVPHTMVAFGRKDFLNDLGCRFVFYVLRVTRGMSIGSTGLLSVFQVVTISPRNSRWAALKPQAINYIGPFIVLSWVLHLMVNSIYPIYVSVQRSNRTITRKRNLGYCSFPRDDNITLLIYTVFVSSHDVFCLGLMCWASGSMVFILYRHRQQVKYIYENKLFHRSSPEMRISQRVLVLVGTFVTFYTISSVINAYLALFYYDPRRWLVNMSSFISSCFPTISPFILMTSKSHVLRFCYVYCERNFHLRFKIESSCFYTIGSHCLNHLSLYLKPKKERKKEIPQIILTAECEGLAQLRVCPMIDNK